MTETLAAETETVMVLASEPKVSSPEKRTRRPRTDKPDEKRPRIKRGTEINELKAWLATLELGITPGVHVNGAAHQSCVLVVDFGTPLKGIKITQEQSGELIARIRAATKLVMNREVKVGIMSDTHNGIWWSNVSS